MLGVRGIGPEHLRDDAEAAGRRERCPYTTPSPFCQIDHVLIVTMNDIKQP